MRSPFSRAMYRAIRYEAAAPCCNAPFEPVENGRRLTLREWGRSRPTLIKATQVGGYAAATAASSHPPPRAGPEGAT
jgi:hypothetical protein